MLAQIRQERKSRALTQTETGTWLDMFPSCEAGPGGNPTHAQNDQLNTLSRGTEEIVAPIGEAYAAAGFMREQKSKVVDRLLATAAECDSTPKSST